METENVADVAAVVGLKKRNCMAEETTPFDDDLHCSRRVIGRHRETELPHRLQLLGCYYWGACSGVRIIIRDPFDLHEGTWSDFVFRCTKRCEFVHIFLAY